MGAKLLHVQSRKRVDGWWLKEIRHCAKDWLLALSDGLEGEV